MSTAHGEQTEKPFGAAEMEEPGIVPGVITEAGESAMRSLASDRAQGRRLSRCLTITTH